MKKKEEILEKWKKSTGEKNCKNDEKEKKKIIIIFFSGTLAEASKFSQWSQNSVAFVAWQILEALEYLHDQKFAHR